MIQTQQQESIFGAKVGRNEFGMQQVLHNQTAHSVQSNSVDRRYGNLYSFELCSLFELFNNPQPGMLIFTFFLTVGIEFVMLKFVFLGVHFYIGLCLCTYIVYLLFSLAFSNPGFVFEYYDKLQDHLDHGQCTEKCRHAKNINEEFNYFCNKCNIVTTKETRHCNICNCCILEYDHHCVFIGKCVGKNNLSNFKYFICFIFSTMIYGLISALYTINQIKTLSK